MGFELFDFQTQRRPNFTPISLSENFAELWTNEFFKKAILNAAPDLYFYLLEHPDISKDVKLKKSILKYWIRGTTRPTPYGYFSGLTFGKIQISTKENHPYKSDPYLSNYYSKLDGSLLLAFVDRFLSIKSLRKHLNFVINSSIATYSNGDCRYIEYSLVPERLEFKISKFIKDEFISQILRTCTKLNFEQFVIEIKKIDADLEQEDIWEYFNELIDSKILIWELWPTGIISTFQNEKTIFDALKQIKQKHFKIADYRFDELFKSFSKLIHLDLLEIEPQDLQHIISQLRANEIPFKENSIYQIHTTFQNNDLNLSRSDVANLKSAISILINANREKENSSLKDFVTKFTEKHQQNEVSLLEVLDPVNGIGYPPSETFAFTTPEAVKDILPVNITKGSRSITSEIKNIIDRKISSALMLGNKFIDLLEEDVKNLPNSDSLLPYTFNSTVSIFQESESDRKIYLKDIYGPSSTKIIGRFTTLDDGIKEDFERIRAQEQRFNQDLVMAEISLIPQPRILNVVDRSDAFDYEISIFNKSNNKSIKIDLSDLTISIRNGWVFIRSKTLQKYILPTFSNVYNYGSHSLGILKLLCDIQGQGKINYCSWEWGEYSNIEFLPGIQYRNLILSRPTLNIHFEDISKDKFFDLITKKAEQFGFSRSVQFGLMDNELSIDLNDKLALELMYDHYKKFKELKIYDSFWNNSERYQPNEFILFWTNDDTKNVRVPTTPVDKLSQEKFFPFDRWVYLKIYADYQSIDLILRDILTPSVFKFRKKYNISNFHFVRYYDTASHLRVRFEVLNNPHIVPLLLHDIHSLISNWNNKNHIVKIEYGTFEREVERYQDIPFSEAFFTSDSVTVLKAISDIQLADEERGRILVAVSMLMQYMAMFDIPIDQKINLFESLEKNFRAENNLSNKAGSKILTKKYAEFENVLLGFKNEDYGPYYNIQALLNFQKKMFVRLPKYQDRNKILMNIPDYIHMTCNRIFTNHNRTYEALIYYIIYRQLKRESALLKQR